MDLFIQELFKKQQEARQLVTDLDIAIKAIQKTCDHPKWNDAGHDSHHNYKVCDRCGHEEKC